MTDLNRPTDATAAAEHRTTPMSGRHPSRRTVLRAAGLVALAGGGAVGLAACGADEPTTTGPASSAPSSTAPSSSAPSSSAPSSEAPASEAPSSSTPKATTAPKPSGPSVATSDVPVGGGVILEDADYVITQPTKGDFKAFSKICTHQGCPLTSVEDGQIKCTCHGSTFSVKDGSVTNPPASKPLAESKTTVSGDKVYVTT